MEFTFKNEGTLLRRDFHITNWALNAFKSEYDLYINKPAGIYLFYYKMKWRVLLCSAL